MSVVGLWSKPQAQASLIIVVCLQRQTHTVTNNSNIKQCTSYGHKLLYAPILRRICAQFQSEKVRVRVSVCGTVIPHHTKNGRQPLVADSTDFI